MVAIKHQAADRFLRSPDRAISAILVFGTDEGLVAERARTAADRLATREDPPGEILRIEDADLEGDPDRLALELMTIPMFGGRKIVRTSTSRRVNAALLKPLLEDGLQGCLVVEAGNLKRDDALRLMFEKSAAAAAIACYPDEGAGIDALIGEVLEANHGLKVTPDARSRLQTRLGADRALSRGELDKLALYVGEGTVTVEHVDAIVGDAADSTVERIVGATLLGQTARAVGELDRAMMAGETAQSIIGAVQRQLLRLHRLAASVASGKSIDELLRTSRPPLPIQAQQEMAEQLRIWPVAQLTAANRRVASYVAKSRQTGAPDDLLAERMVLDLCNRAAQARRR